MGAIFAVSPMECPLAFKGCEEHKRIIKACANPDDFTLQKIEPAVAVFTG